MHNYYANKTGELAHYAVYMLHNHHLHPWCGAGDDLFRAVSDPVKCSLLKSKWCRLKFLCSFLSQSILFKCSDVLQKVSGTAPPSLPAFVFCCRSMLVCCSCQTLRIFLLLCPISCFRQPAMGDSWG